MLTTFREKESHLLAFTALMGLYSERHLTFQFGLAVANYDAHVVNYIRHNPVLTTVQ